MATPLVVIDRGSPMPVYVQLAEILREQISAGRYGPGRAGRDVAAGGGHRQVVRGGQDVGAARAGGAGHEGLIVTERGSPASMRLQPQRTFVDLASTDRMVARVPTCHEAQQLGLPAGVPLLHVLHADGTVQTFPADRFGVQGATHP